MVILVHHSPKKSTRCSLALVHFHKPSPCCLKQVQIKARVPLRTVEECKWLLIFSKNHATSNCCLDELAKILVDCKKMNGQIKYILPTFYIDPSTIRNQTGTHAVTFAKHDHQYLT